MTDVTPTLPAPSESPDPAPRPRGRQPRWAVAIALAGIAAILVGLLTFGPEAGLHFTSAGVAPPPEAAEAIGSDQTSIARAFIAALDRGDLATVRALLTPGSMTLEVPGLLPANGVGALVAGTVVDQFQAISGRLTVDACTVRVTPTGTTVWCSAVFSDAFGVAIRAPEILVTLWFEIDEARIIGGGVLPTISPV